MVLLWLDLPVIMLASGMLWGFCLHNNAAIAALVAQAAGAKKVLIVDWDVHHGNGTQEIFEENKSVSCLILCMSAPRFWSVGCGWYKWWGRLLCKCSMELVMKTTSLRFNMWFHP